MPMKKFLLPAAILFGAASLSDAANLVGWWNFDDGTASDSSGNGNNGTFQNGAGVSAAVANATAGSQSLSLGGGTQHVLVPHDPSLTLPSEITITAWVRPSGTGWGGIVAKSPSDGGGANHAGNYELRLQANANQSVQWLYEPGPGINSTVTLTAPGAGPAVGQWSHIALTHDSGGNFTYYLNGASVSSGTGPTFGTLTNANPLYLGSRADLFTTFTGDLDEISIWDGALTGGEVADIFANGIPEPSSALLGLVGLAGLAFRRRR